VRSVDDLPVPVHNVLESLPSGIALVDVRGIIGDLNQCLAAMTGYEFGELIGQNIGMILPEFHQLSHLIAHRGFANDTGVPQVHTNQDVNVSRHDGSLLSIDFTSSHLELDGKLWTLVSISDNTAQKEAERGRMAAEGRADRGRNCRCRCTRAE
jgi:PAS domain S-box-containing protein